MPNWKKVIVSGSDATLKSVTIPGSLGSTTFNTNADTLVFSGSAYFTGSTIVSGSLEAPSITGSLLGTASYALNTPTSSYSSTASYVNPLRQTVELTGSLNVSGSTTQIGNNNLIGNTSLSGSVNISGSITGSYDLSIGGYLKLEPSLDPGPQNITASYLFTSASNTNTGFDLYYRQATNIVKFKWLEGGLSTGILWGGVVSYSGSNIYITPGAGIVNTLNASTSSEVAPIFTYITWNAYTASATYLTSSQNTYLYVDNVGSIHQQTTYFTEAQYQQSLPLGRVTHANYVNITGVGSNVQTTYDSDQQQNEFIRSFGPMKVNGLTLTGQTGSLRFDIGGGTSFNLGGFYPQDPSFPSQYTSTSALTASIARAYRSGSGIHLDNNGGAFYTTIDPTKYDDGSGTPASLTGGQYSVQRVFYNPVSKRTTVYYGQATYNSLSTALQSLNTETFTEGEFTAKSLIFVSYIIAKGNASDLGNTNDVAIIQGGLFRNTTGGSGGSGVVPTYLHDLADVVETNPTSGQALVYNGSVWVNGTPLNATTASYTTLAQTASYVSQAVSSSYALTASYALNVPVTASYALTASYVV